MLNNRCRFAVFTLAIALIMVLLTGCNGNNTPPDMINAQQVFQNNCNDIHTIVQFLTGLDCRNVYIDDDGESMLADLVNVPINNVEVSAAIKRLFKTYLSIDKIDNTIHLLQWRGSKDIGCGIAYSINGIEPPVVQFMTELTPLTEVGWFYYVSDYNTWRNNTTRE